MSDIDTVKARAEAIKLLLLRYPDVFTIFKETEDNNGQQRFIYAKVVPAAIFRYNNKFPDVMFEGSASTNNENGLEIYFHINDKEVLVIYFFTAPPAKIASLDKLLPAYSISTGINTAVSANAFFLDESALNAIDLTASALPDPDSQINIKLQSLLFLTSISKHGYEYLTQVRDYVTEKVREAYKEYQNKASNLEA